jgi:hypothetical protein
MRRSVIASLVILLASPVVAQTPKTRSAPRASSKTWAPPRTPDGQPDLQGVWLNNSATPLQRPQALEGKPFLTDEEVVELKKRAAHLFDATGGSDFASGDAYFLAVVGNAERYRNPGATGGSVEMIEREFENRTSLIVDPPDGKIPALTPEGRERNLKSPPAAGGGPRLPAGPEDLSNSLRCLTYGVPRVGQTNVASAGPLAYYQIVQAPGYVVLAMEAIH